MSSTLAWSDEALQQSCSKQACARAAIWVSRREAIYEKLLQLAARQPLVALHTQPDMLHHILQQTAALSKISERLVVIGTGGASLGAQAFCALADNPQRVTFLENCDPATLSAVLRAPEKTSWCIISKSGETVETLAGALCLLPLAQQDPEFAARVRVITAAPNSPLGRLAADQGWTVLPHPAELGGRFSIFSIVGLLPASYAGIDVAEVARMAHITMQQLLQQKDVPLLQHAAWLAANAEEKPMHLLMAYADRLRPATQWFKQLWAESLGKDGRGSTPVTAIGAIDQHSQLQLYLDGPRNKLVTLWLPQMAGMGARIPKVAIDGLAYLGGHAMGDVMHATAEATARTLANAGVPLRVLRAPLTPASLAEWMVRQMLEVLLIALLLEVDPYSQPAVEEGKKLTRAALAKRG